MLPGPSPTSSDTTPSSYVPSRFTCNTCQASFATSTLQREHMKGQWHVYNLKRKIAELPPLDWDVFEAQVLPATKEEAKSSDTTQEGVGAEKGSESTSESESDTASDVDACLFCNHRPDVFDEDTGNAFNELVEHMLAVHSFFIPSIEGLTSLETFLRYLSVIVSQYHECLYCGAARATKEAIQQHMRNSGHCMLNLNREPELLDFWEASSEDEGNTESATALADRFSKTELRLLGKSGTVRSKEGATKAAKLARKARMAASSRALIATEGSHEAREEAAEGKGTTELPQPAASSTPSQDRQLARRNEQGMLGVSLHQRQALLVMEKKSQHREQVRVKAEEWSRERIANKQKHYRAAGPMRPNG